MARTIEDVQPRVYEDLCIRESQFEAVCELNRKLLQAIRLVYADLQQIEPDIVRCRRLLGDSYPGGVTALIKGANGKSGRQNR